MGTRPINRTDRLTTIERMLFRSPIGLRAVEIAQSCGVDRRTIYRDLSLLSDVGVPVRQEDGRFFINREQYLATVRLSSNEAMALYIAARVLSQHTDLQNPHIVSALRKISHALPELSGAHVSFVTELMPETPVDRGLVAVLETITRAWGEQRKVKIWYSSITGRETTARAFSTYFIEPTPSGKLYVVGFDGLSQHIRGFRLRQIKRAKILRDNYELPSRFSPRRYLSSAWGMMDAGNDRTVDVVLAFSANIAPLITERVRHITQQIEILDDGDCILSVQVSDWKEMLPWIRSWGAQVEVLAPRALREAIAAEVAQVAAMYKSSVSRELATTPDS